MGRARVDIKATVRDRRGRVIGVGTNSYTKTHPLAFKAASTLGTPWKVFVHAELAALLEARKASTEAHSISVERYLKDGTPALAKPCSVCMKLIEDFGIKEVKYTE